MLRTQGIASELYSLAITAQRKQNLPGLSTCSSKDNVIKYQKSFESSTMRKVRQWLLIVNRFTVSEAYKNRGSINAQRGRDKTPCHLSLQLDKRLMKW
jgi:hypothetical protein